MRYNHYVEVLQSYGFRELGYFNGLETYLGVDMLITIESYRGGFRASFDSVARNIGEVYYCKTDSILCDLINEMAGGCVDENKNLL